MPKSRMTTMTTVNRRYSTVFLPPFQPFGKAGRAAKSTAPYPNEGGKCGMCGARSCRLTSLLLAVRYDGPFASGLRQGRTRAARAQTKAAPTRDGRRIATGVGSERWAGNKEHSIHKPPTAATSSSLSMLVRLVRTYPVASDSLSYFVRIRSCG